MLLVIELFVTLVRGWLLFLAVAIKLAFGIVFHSAGEVELVVNETVVVVVCFDLRGIAIGESLCGWSSCK